MSNGKYLIFAALTCLAILLGGVGINWSVDPDNLFGNNWTGIYVDNDRFAKKQLVKSYPHDAILIGSSKVATIDPDDLRGRQYFNASMVGVVPEEFLFFLRDNVENVDLVVMGLDFYMFNERESPFVEDKTEIPRGATDGLSYVFSANILRAAIDSVYKHLSGVTPLVLNDGQRNPDFKIRADRIFNAPEYAKILKYLDESHYASFTYSTRRVEVLREIKRLMEQRGTKLIVFINPLNAEVLKLLQNKPEWRAFMRFRQDVATVFPDVRDLSDSDWSAPEKYYFSDPWHYRPDVGADMINSLVN